MTEIKLHNLKGDMSLLEVLRDRGLEVPSDCGGMGTCGKCRVILLEGSGHMEADSARSREDTGSGREVLACREFPEGDVKVELVEQSLSGMRIQTESAFEISDDQRRAGIGIDGQGRHAADTVGQDRQSADTGDRNRRAKGALDRTLVAVDIGTTTIAGVLASGGKVVKSYGIPNSQIGFGADVISRIKAATSGHADELTACVRRDVLKIVRSLLERGGVDSENAVSVSADSENAGTMNKVDLFITGNTCMEALFMGEDVSGLAEAPYIAETLETRSISAEDLFGSTALGLGCVTVLPGIGGFVGADIVCGIAAVGMAENSEITALIDIGTNGEIALGNKDKILVTSTAAGPALEGGEISCGMASVSGAISKVELSMAEGDSDGSDVEVLVELETIGAAPPKGLCGTGIISAASEMLDVGIVDSTGLLADKYFEEGFPLSGEIKITQQDIRNLQMAKAAIRAGLEVLAAEYGIPVSAITKLYVSGGFGTALNPEKAARIGLIPDYREEVAASEVSRDHASKIDAVIVETAGNSALAGTVIIAEDPALAERIVELSTAIDLAEREDFQRIYIDEMNFPER